LRVCTIHGMLDLMSNTTETVSLSYTGLTITPKPQSTVEISAEIPLECVHVYQAKALEKVRREVELPGFRKGHVPADMVEKHVGEQALLEETAELAISRAYADIVVDNKLDVVGRPAVTVTKLAQGNPIGFKIVSAVYPTVSLPDYRALATAELKKHDDPEKAGVSDADIDAELKRLQGMLGDMMKQASKDETDENIDKKEELPEINDDFARVLGDFSDLNDLKSKLRDKMLVEQKTKMLEKRRLALLDRILEKTNVEIPDLFIEGELDQMVNGFEERVVRAGLELDAYLKQADKTIEDLRKEWRTDAEKRAKLQIVLGEIAKKDSITPDEARLDREVAHVLEHYPEAEEHAVRAYVTSQMTNELVFASLEGREPVFEEHDHSHEEGHVHE
jgi:FKBP-type peptidyl-prolyl cis-trans isomerase (trigger factor)